MVVEPRDLISLISYTFIFTNTHHHEHIFCLQPVIAIKKYWEHFLKASLSLVHLGNKTVTMKVQPSVFSFKVPGKEAQEQRDGANDLWRSKKGWLETARKSSLSNAASWAKEKQL